MQPRNTRGGLEPGGAGGAVACHVAPLPLPLPLPLSLPLPPSLPLPRPPPSPRRARRVEGGGVRGGRRSEEQGLRARARGLRASCPDPPGKVNASV
eukprot:761790-Rhodomonas_salina.1